MIHGIKLCLGIVIPRIAHASQMVIALKKSLHP
jgi:hypothetical protein